LADKSPSHGWLGPGYTEPLSSPQRECELAPFACEPHRTGDADYGDVFPPLACRAILAPARQDRPMIAGPEARRASGCRCSSDSVRPICSVTLSACPDHTEADVVLASAGSRSFPPASHARDGRRASRPAIEPGRMHPTRYRVIHARDASLAGSLAPDRPAAASSAAVRSSPSPKNPAMNIWPGSLVGAGGRAALEPGTCKELNHGTARRLRTPPHPSICRPGDLRLARIGATP
jgi:hypothetical protein